MSNRLAARTGRLLLTGLLCLTAGCQRPGPERAASNAAPPAPAPARVPSRREQSEKRIDKAFAGFRKQLEAQRAQAKTPAEKQQVEKQLADLENTITKLKEAQAKADLHIKSLENLKALAVALVHYAQAHGD